MCSVPRTTCSGGDSSNACGVTMQLAQSLRKAARSICPATSLIAERRQGRPMREHVPGTSELTRG